ncbi:MAG: hypothetical protein O2897_04670 [bacterium]|nr:hypothetical protein [bacterium]
MCSCIVKLKKILAIYFCVLLVPFTALSHFLDQLAADEIEQSAAILKANKILGNGFYLQELSVKVPDINLGDSKQPRLAKAVIVHHEKQENLELVLDIGLGQIISRKQILNGQPSMIEADMTLMESLLRSDERFKTALERRGLDDETKIHIDPWAMGDSRFENINLDHRLFRCVFYYTGESQNPFSRPIEGLSAILDLTDIKVAEFVDTGVVPIAKEAHDFFKETAAQVARAQVQKFKNKSTKNKFVSWKNWRFHVDVHPKEGLVFSQVGYFDDGRVRSILNRASLAEMIVPYSDPDKNWFWRAAFDEGEYAVGVNTHSLLPGIHVPSEADFYKVNFATQDGLVKTIPKGFAIFERDGGLLWSHQNTVSGDIAAKRGRELVVVSMFTVANYDYAMQWVFKEDGTIDVQMLLTGIVSAKGVKTKSCRRCQVYPAAEEPAEDDTFGSIVDANLVGTTHQHFFTFRLDFAIEGDSNSIAEIIFNRVSGKKENPAGNKFLLQKQTIKFEQDSGRSANDANGKKWLVFNPNIKNSLGHFPGYTIVPGPSAVPLADPGPEGGLHAEYLKHHLWVTKYDPEEMYPAGDYPSQNDEDGIIKWINRNSSIENTNIVAWYTMGLIHWPCPEDWPVMPVAKAGFTLKPMGFFTQNPTLSKSEARD